MSGQQSAVQDGSLTGNATVVKTKASTKKAKQTPAEIRAQIKDERGVLKGFKEELKFAKANLRDTLKEGKSTVVAATQKLKQVTSEHAREVKADEKAITSAEKIATKQQAVIDKLTAKLK